MSNRRHGRAVAAEALVNLPASQLAREVTALKRQLKQVEQHADRQTAAANLRLAMLKHVVGGRPTAPDVMTAIVKYVASDGSFNDSRDSLVETEDGGLCAVHMEV